MKNVSTMFTIARPNCQWSELCYSNCTTSESRLQALDSLRIRLV